MSIKIRDLVLYLIDRCGERTEFGRTSIQKVTYFAGLLLDQDFGHGAYYYGPFSPEVERSIENLVLSGLVKETVTPLGYSTRSGFGVKRYEYTVDAQGTERVKEIADVHGDDVERVDRLLDLLMAHAGGLDQSVLSPAAKVHYIAQLQGRAVDVNEIKQAGADLGWDLTESQVKRVVVLLEKLGFATLLADL
jgi:hypothetical protein